MLVWKALTRTSRQLVRKEEMLSASGAGPTPDAQQLEILSPSPSTLWTEVIQRQQGDLMCNSYA
eukprot:1593598-Amphidinium_carterae.1